MIPQQAITKAIEGGWKPKNTEITGNCLPVGNGWSFVQLRSSLEDARFFVVFSDIALDPTFWQALGKALGWKEWKTTALIYDELTWYYQGRRFCYLILTGGDTEKFWADLLSN